MPAIGFGLSDLLKKRYAKYDEPREPGQEAIWAAPPDTLPEFINESVLPFYEQRMGLKDWRNPDTFMEGVMWALPSLFGKAKSAEKLAADALIPGFDDFINEESMLKYMTRDMPQDEAQDTLANVLGYRLGDPASRRTTQDVIDRITGENLSFSNPLEEFVDEVDEIVPWQQCTTDRATRSFLDSQAKRAAHQEKVYAQVKPFVDKMIKHSGIGSEATPEEVSLSVRRAIDTLLQAEAPGGKWTGLAGEDVPNVGLTRKEILDYLSTGNPYRVKTYPGEIQKLAGKSLPSLEEYSWNWVEPAVEEAPTNQARREMKAAIRRLATDYDKKRRAAITTEQVSKELEKLGLKLEQVGEPVSYESVPPGSWTPSYELDASEYLKSILGKPEATREEISPFVKYFRKQIANNVRFPDEYSNDWLDPETLQTISSYSLGTGPRSLEEILRIEPALLRELERQGLLLPESYKPGPKIISLYEKSMQRAGRKLGREYDVAPSLAQAETPFEYQLSKLLEKAKEQGVRLNPQDLKKLDPAVYQRYESHIKSALRNVKTPEEIKVPKSDKYKVSWSGGAEKYRAHGIDPTLENAKYLRVTVDPRTREGQEILSIAREGIGHEGEVLADKFPTVGWLKVNEVDPKKWFIEEIQTDVVNKGSATSDVTKKKLADWAETGLANVLSEARRKGIKEVHIVDPDFLRMNHWKGHLGEAKSNIFYRELPKKFGFTMSQPGTVTNLTETLKFKHPVSKQIVAHIERTMDNPVAGEFPASLSPQLLDDLSKMSAPKLRAVLADSLRAMGYSQENIKTIIGNWNENVASGEWEDAVWGVGETIRTAVEGARFKPAPTGPGLNLKVNRSGFGYDAGLTGETKFVPTSWRVPAIVFTATGAGAGARARRKEEY